MKRTLSFILLCASIEAGAEQAAMLLYERTEAGTESYASRYIVTSRFLRLDMGEPDGDFVLYDRNARIIYSVVRRDRTIATVEPRAMESEPPLALHLREERVSLGARAPEIAGRAPVQHRLYSGDRLCLDVVAVPGLLEDAVAARREMGRVLAAEHAATLVSVPADMHDACDLAVNIFNADWVTGFGLPIQEQDFAGNSQQLMDYREKFDAAPSLFVLPEGYTRYSVSGLK
jgi:hypothetical protein